ncbi:hypothetical protein KRX52_11660 [Pseudomonas sp. MAP12]|uniref:DUF983 domain-containing protein n=1 Tax=Geopseudomonas aromaticivorans TaxID=2849492 RepID=A0ABS6MXA8_9GAMM|nr:hypothetical protein [Pseudomonas aromaticivorans]MBV2133445.1 hypothetical protein [Pseudomonas aromaticivorans]
MDSRCPACRTELQGRYLGTLDIRCPHCAAALRYNVHPMENGPWHLEIGIYVFGFASLAVAAVTTVLLGWPPVLALLVALGATMAYAWAAWRRARRSIPQDWPRWRAESHSRRSPPR